MGLALAGCAGDDGSGPVGEAYGSPDFETFDTATTTTGGDTSSTGGATSSTGGVTSSPGRDTSSTGSDTSSTTGGTDTDGSTGGSSQGSSTSLGPDYGVPTTTGE